MTTYRGSMGTKALFSTDDERGAIVDALTFEVEVVDVRQSLALGEWSSDSPPSAPLSVLSELAEAELADVYKDDVIVSGGGERLYTVPKSVQAEAKKALEWRKEHKRGGTPVGLNTARTLARGGQVGIKKVRHIARYFPRHEVDKKAKGYKPGEPGYPSRGRIAWSLWGGDAGWRWARAIVERENAREARSAHGESDMTDALRAIVAPPSGASFYAMMPDVTDHSAVGLMLRDAGGSWLSWDDGSWESVEEADLVIPLLLEIDAHTAMQLAGALYDFPEAPVRFEDVDPREHALFVDAVDEIDWALIDSLTAAGSNTDGNYTPEERSANVSKQARDAAGRFVQAGGRVIISDDPRFQGFVESVGGDGNVSVKLDSGQVVSVPAGTTRNVDRAIPLAPTAEAPLDLSGIIAEPRMPINSPVARLANTLPVMTPEMLQQVIADWPQYVADQRASYEASKDIKPTEPIDTSPDPLDLPPHPWERDRDRYRYTPRSAGAPGRDYYGRRIPGDWATPPRPQDDPYIGSWIRRPENQRWYAPAFASLGLIAAAEGKSKGKSKKDAEDSKELTPQTSDVKPMFFAIVDKDDPQAVLDLVSIVPKSKASTEPIAFTRRGGEWVKDESIMSDLRSPTPPPVVALDKPEDFVNVLEQTDRASEEVAKSDFKQGETSAPLVASLIPDSYLYPLWATGEDIEALLAAGSDRARARWDRNRGNAERLRRYWTTGEGGAKIKWGVGGDWKRCVRYLSKYLGPRAKGYCNLRHKETTGMYPATHAKLLRGKSNSAGEEETLVTEDDLDMSLEDIFAEDDEYYDPDWNPADEIALALLETAELGERALAILAAGGADRNRGNAERLRRYWTTGEGGAKIQWGTEGDWRRCVASLSKYMGPRAKGYCALRHREMTGMWAGDSDKHGAFEATESIIASRALVAAADVARERARAAISGETGYGSPVLVDPSDVSDERSGARFSIPLVIPEGVESGDGRVFEKGALELRDLPLPLLWQISTDEGHNGSVLVGRIDRMVRTDSGIGEATGVFDSGPYGREAERLVREGFLRGVSADLDQFEAKENKRKKAENAEGTDDTIESDRIKITKGRVMAVTLVPKPAFQECTIEIVDDSAGDAATPDGVYEEQPVDGDTKALVACAAIVAAPVVPPRAWFEQPKLDGPTALTVDDDGRVYGHVAAWHVNHIGLPFGTRPPRSKSRYAYFHTGVLRTDDGADVPVGQLTLAGGHAPLEASASEAARHYDDTSSAIADVHAGEDQYGIWVAGALRPEATPEQIRALRASAPSGDWRPINGSLELVAVCQVNVPGFPTARARVASGQVMALVAAGALTTKRLSTAAEASARVASVKTELVSARLRSSIEDISSFADIGPETRKRLAKEGKALPDGSYPIRNVPDLKNAIRAYGRAAEGDRAKVRRHIIRRARALGRGELIPDEWRKTAEYAADIDQTALLRRAAQAAARSVAAAAPVKPRVAAAGRPPLIIDREAARRRAERQPRDARGQFRLILARLKQNLGSGEQMQSVLDKVAMAQNLANVGNYEAAEAEAAKVMELVDKIDAGALDPKSLQNVKNGAAALGGLLANLPLPFGSPEEKMRFSDMPPVLKGLIKDFVDRVEDKIGEDDASGANDALKSFMSGNLVLNQQGVASELNKLMRLLT